MVDPGYLVYVRGILLPSYMGILICHCKDPCKLISTMESQKGFERCSSVNSSNQFWPNNTQWCFQILNPLRYMTYPFPKKMVGTICSPYQISKYLKCSTCRVLHINLLQHISFQYTVVIRSDMTYTHNTTRVRLELDKVHGFWSQDFQEHGFRFGNSHGRYTVTAGSLESMMTFFRCYGLLLTFRECIYCF